VQLPTLTLEIDVDDPHKFTRVLREYAKFDEREGLLSAIETGEIAVPFSQPCVCCGRLRYFWGEHEMCCPGILIQESCPHFQDCKAPDREDTLCPHPEIKETWKSKLDQPRIIKIGKGRILVNR